MTAPASLAVEKVETRVGTVEMHRRGSGGPLVYLHSAAGEGAGLAFLDELAARHEVFAPVFPGYGASEGIEQIDDMEDAVFHLLDLFDRLQLQAPAVVGLSLGGWMAAELATRYPDRVAKLVMINPVGLYIQGAEVKDLFGRSPADMARDLFADLSLPAPRAMLQMDRAMSDMAGQAGSIPFDLIKPQLQAMTATARLGWDPYLHNPKLQQRLHRVTAPTLVIRATEDTLVPAAHAQTYAKEIPGARLVELPAAAHLAPVEKPNEAAALVNEFLG